MIILIQERGELCKNSDSWHKKARLHDRKREAARIKRNIGSMNFRPFLRETLWNGYNKKRHRSSNLGGTASTVYTTEFQRPDMVESALISRPLSFVYAARTRNTRKAKWRRTILDYHFVCRICFQEGDYHSSGSF